MRLLLFSLFISLIFLNCNNGDVVTSPGNLTKILTEFHNTSSQKVLIAAHRASNRKFPENSLAAIQHSIETGVDIKEVS